MITNNEFRTPIVMYTRENFKRGFLEMQTISNCFSTFFARASETFKFFSQLCPAENYDFVSSFRAIYISLPSASSTRFFQAAAEEKK